MWGVGTTQIVILRTFRLIILQANCGKLIFGKTQLWSFGITIFWESKFWQNNTLATWYFGKIIFWQNDTAAKQYFGKMILWQNNTLAKSYLGIHIGRFPNKHPVQSKRFCKSVHEIATVWMAEEPPIQRFCIFTGKTKQEHHEANGPPGTRIMCY